jgi:pimeloyl-ACP methyl ester carboxylesterase
LLVRGENDQYATTADHLTLRERLRSARSFTVPGAGHAPHWERPEEVAYMLRAFVAELDDADILRHAVFG